mmetsp:Transcript_36119/g.77896  ORF Transcript_36119/g.77896 Transcript_36119/m.77896 type:complete len:323 (-) Transcript_36119:469-1437(-)
MFGVIFYLCVGTAKVTPHRRTATILEQFRQHIPQVMRHVRKLQGGILVRRAIHNFDLGSDPVRFPTQLHDAGRRPPHLLDRIAILLNGSADPVPTVRSILRRRQRVILVVQQFQSPLGLELFSVEGIGILVVPRQHVMLHQKSQSDARREESIETLLHLGQPSRIHRRLPIVLQTPQSPGDGHGNGMSIQYQTLEFVREFPLGFRIGRHREIAQPFQVSEVGVGDGLDLAGAIESVGQGEEVDGALGDADGEFLVEELGVAEATDVDESAAIFLVEGGVRVAGSSLGSVSVHVSEGEGGGLAGCQGEQFVHGNFHGGGGGRG